MAELASPEIAPSNPGERFYEFDDFRLYPFRRLLVRGDRPVSVTPKVLDTLQVLVANSGRLVTKEQLMSAVWADTIVEESGLTRNISVLRKVLGRDANGHGYIATLPGRGYQFVASVFDYAGLTAKPTGPHLVGRDKERAALRSGFQIVQSGRGLLLCVGGEPGIGKTALIEEFLLELDADGEACTVARARCSERLTGTGAALPWLELLDGLSRNENGTAFRKSHGESVTGAIKTHAPGWYLQLSSLTAADPEISPDAELRTASQERLKLELNALLQHLTRKQPLVLFLDDLHWADASTSDLLSFLVGRFASLRVLVLATYRPTDMRLSRHPLLQFKPHWQAHGDCREVTLDFLNRAAVDEYLEIEFPHHAFPSSLPDLIHERTSGNPLFMTELVRDLRARGLVASQNGRWLLTSSLSEVERGLPESIRGLIESKIAQLDESEARLLEAASAQGYDFDSAVLASALDDHPAEVEERLAALERVKSFVSFVAEKELPDGTMTLHYRFVHVLYQEAIYSRVQPTRLIELSSRIADTMIRHWADRSTEVASELATLYETARNWHRAAEFFRLSARRASRFAAAGDAVIVARRGLAAHKRLPPTSADARIELELNVILGVSLILTGHWESPETEAALSRAYELGQVLKDDANVLAAEWGQVVSHCVRGRFREARILGEEMIALAEQTGDPAQRVVAHSALGTILVQLGELDAGTRHLEYALSIYDPNQLASHPSLSAVDFGVRCRCYLARGLWLRGLPESGRRQIQDAIDITQQAPASSLLMLALLSACTVHQFLREDKTCRQIAESVIELSRSAGRTPQTENVGWAPVTLGWSFAQSGRALEGVGMMRKSLRAYRVRGRGWIAQSVLFAEVLGDAGEFDEALQTLSAVLSLIQETGERFFEAEIHRVWGDVLLKKALANGPDLSEDTIRESTTHFFQALEVARRQGARSLELRASMSLARLWQKTGRNSEAQALLTTIYDSFTEGFETRDLQTARALLDDLSAKPAPDLQFS